MNTHKIVLMNYQDKLESVAMTNTESLSEEHILVMIKGGHRLIPISAMDTYQAEAKTYTAAVKQLYKKFKNKGITEAEAYCRQRNLSYSVITD